MLLYLFFVAIVQGITEFLPVSSTAHLIFASYLFKQGEPNLIINVGLHLGTLMAVTYIFKQELKDMFMAVIGCVFRKEYNASAFMMAMMFIVATIPAIIVGYILKKVIGDIHNSLTLLGTSSIIFGTLMYLADRNPNTNGDFGFKNSFLMGLGQTLAFIPGASRLGSCITVARLLGVERQFAMTLSLVMSIPVVLGAVTLTTIDAIKADAFHVDGLLVGIIFLTAIIGVAVGKWIINFLETHSFLGFAIYRVLFGIALLGIGLLS